MASTIKVDEILDSQGNQFDGSQLGNVGKVLQVVHYSDTTNRSTASAVWVDTGISWSFSPTLSNSRIIFNFSMAFALDDQVQFGNARMLVNGVERVKTAPTQGYSFSGRDESTFTKTIEHQCTSLSPVVVTFDFACADATIYMNRPPRMASGYADVFTSAMTAMEIGA